MPNFRLGGLSSRFGRGGPPKSICISSSIFLKPTCIHGQVGAGMHDKVTSAESRWGPALKATIPCKNGMRDRKDQVQSRRKNIKRGASPKAE